MRTGGTTALTLRGACIAAGLTFFFGTARAEIPVQIALSDAAVSITADNSTIRSVLQELALRTNLLVISDDALDEPVTVNIQEPTVPEAIRRLLRQKSYMLHQPGHVSPSENPGSATHMTLWIFPAESGESHQAWTTDPAMLDYQILALSAESGDRAEAMYGFGIIGGDSGLEYVQQGLSDPDKQVRQEAIQSLIEIGGTESMQALSGVLNDPDARLRIDAVDAMGEIGGQDAINYLQIAMTNENHSVREAAAEWLTELGWQLDYRFSSPDQL